jgi:hypothetical protein
LNNFEPEAEFNPSVPAKSRLGRRSRGLRPLDRRDPAVAGAPHVRPLADRIGGDAERQPGRWRRNAAPFRPEQAVERSRRQPGEQGETVARLRQRLLKRGHRRAGLLQAGFRLLHFELVDLPRLLAPGRQLVRFLAALQARL